MTALHIFAALPLHLVLLLAQFAGMPEPEPEPLVESIFGAQGLRPETLPGLGAWNRVCYGDF